jgi:hypothetical protein
LHLSVTARRFHLVDSMNIAANARDTTHGGVGRAARRVAAAAGGALGRALVGGVVGAVMLGAPRGVLAQPPAQLPVATLRDQFGGTTAITSPPGAPVVVLASNREGGEAAGRWERQVRAASAGSAVRVLSVADLRGAPRMLRGVIRGQMPKDTATRILLDWDGAVGRPVRGAERPLVAAAYGRDGRLRRWEALPLAVPPAGESAALARALVQAALGQTPGAPAAEP